MNAQLITKENPPQFPCWLWSGNAVNTIPAWYHYTADEWHDVGLMDQQNCFTHWIPDSPTAPTCAPAEQSGQEKAMAIPPFKPSQHTADLKAFNDWEDGIGSECATTSGVWFAALEYARSQPPAREATVTDGELLAFAALIDIRDMPEIDQDDHCRLRHKARLALERITQVRAAQNGRTTL